MERLESAPDHRVIQDLPPWRRGTQPVRPA